MKKHTELKEIWEDKFGANYTDRKLENHQTERGLREKFWSKLVSDLKGIKSIVEVGCNAGMNLEGIYKADNNLSIIGVEPNLYAIEKAKKIANGRYDIIEGNIFDLNDDLKSDLIITCTVLIHISPNELVEAMKNLYDISSSYILIMEYYWPSIKKVEYRGLENALWKQDFGALFLENFDVELVETGFLDERDGFDRTSWWLFKK